MYGGKGVGDVGDVGFPRAFLTIEIENGNL